MIGDKSSLYYPLYYPLPCNSLESLDRKKGSTIMLFITRMHPFNQLPSLSHQPSQSFTGILFHLHVQLCLWAPPQGWLTVCVPNSHLQQSPYKLSRTMKFSTWLSEVPGGKLASHQLDAAVMLLCTAGEIEQWQVLKLVAQGTGWC